MKDYIDIIGYSHGRNTLIQKSGNELYL